MARATRRVEVKLDDETFDRWTAAARDAGYQVYEYVKAAVEAQIAATPSAKRSRAKKAARPAGATRAARTGLCEHRIPPTSHCSRCDP